MIEQIIILEHVDPVVFFGINNSNLQLIKTLFSKLHIVARGNAIKVTGNAEDVPLFEEKIRELEKFSVDRNKLTQEDIIDIVKGNSPNVVKQENLIIYGVNGKPISARTPNQQNFVNSFYKNDMVFGIGPAGSGKTYTAIALAVKALKNKEVKKFTMEISLNLIIIL